MQLEESPSHHRQHRHRSLDNLKEVSVGEGTKEQRFVVCFNKEAAERDKQVRDNLVEYLKTHL